MSTQPLTAFPPQGPADHVQLDPETSTLGLILADNVQIFWDRFIGYGQYSDVYRGILIPKQQQVAVKILRVEDVEKTKIRLRREWRVWAPLDHKNILPFLGFLEANSYRPALVSPFCEGGSIMQHIERHPQVDKASTIFGIAEGLEYLHSKNIVHGDIKSHNVLVDLKSNPVICDFNRSKILEQRGFTTDYTGTRDYTAPELFGATSDCDEAPVSTMESDVYSLGILGTEILTGRTPFSSIKNLSRLLNAVKAGVPATERYTGREYQSTWVVLEQCIETKPENRPSMIEVVLRLPVDRSAPWSAQDYLNILIEG